MPGVAPFVCALNFDKSVISLQVKVAPVFANLLPST
jgi:hypothetical protein